MRATCALLVLTSACRIGFDDVRSMGSDAGADAAPGTRIVTFGERPTSMVSGVTADSTIVEDVDTYNYGGAEDFSVYGNVELGLLRFDLSSLRAVTSC